MSTTPHERRMIGALLRIPFQAVVRRIHAGLAQVGFTDVNSAHFVVFQHMRPEGMRATDLAARAQITKQSMGYLIEYLEARGYVQRVEDPEDKRARLVQLTARGWALDRAARGIVHEVEQEWRQYVGADRFAILEEVLRDLVRTSENGDKRVQT
jgi:DNA-binding MarR family transcriptional regulator